MPHRDPQRGLLPGLLLASALLHGLLFAILTNPQTVASFHADTLHVDLITTQPPAPARPARSVAEPADVLPASPAPRPQRPVSRMAATVPTPSRPQLLPADAAEAQAAARSPAQAPAIMTDSAADPDRLRRQLIASLQPYFSYPRMARRMGWQGEVRLQVTIEPHGRLSRISLASSSGIAGLDQAALDSAGSITLSAATSALLQGRAFDMVLPVTYRLVDG